MDKNKMLKSPVVQDSLVFLILSVALFCYSLYKHYSGLPVQWQMSPYLFPILIAIFLFFLSLSLFADGKRQLAEQEKVAPKPKAPADFRGVLITIAASALYVALMPVLRFIPSTILFLVGMLVYLGERRWWLIGLLSVATAGAIYVIFGVFLNVMLP